MSADPLFRALIEQMPGLVWALSVDRERIYVNQRYVDFFGFKDAHASLFDNWLDPFHPDDRSKREMIWQKANQTGEPYKVEMRMRRASDGMYRWTSADVFPVRSDSNEITHWVGISYDNHDQKMNVARRDHLQNATARFARALSPNDVAEIMMTIGAQGLQANSGIFVLPDESKDGFEIAASTPVPCPHPEFLKDKDHVLKLRELADGCEIVFLADRRSAEGRFPFQQPADVEAMVIVPLSLGGLALFTYNTPQAFDPDFKLFVESLASQCRQALERASLYTRELQARAAAENANRAKTVFVANLSHELRTPLTSIIGFAEVLSGSVSAKEKQKQYAEGIQRNAHSLAKLVEDLLDMSRIEAGQVTVEFQTFDLRTLVKDVVDLFARQAEQRRCRLKIEGVDKLPRKFVSDPLRLRQVLVNVIGNAVKFTENGEVTVDVVSSETSSELEIFVRDSGIGMTDEQIKRIFIEFGQGDSLIRKKFGGTGLGLVISRKIARLLMGDLSLVSTKPGQGSVFRIVIPRAAAVAENREAKERADGPIRDPRHSLKNAKILIADDTEDIRVNLAESLAELGASVDLASDGSEAVARARAGKPDIILMDLRMPITDGWQATRLLRDSGFKRPIIAISANMEPEDRVRCFDVGFDAYAVKPFKISELVSIIRRLQRH